MKIESKIVENLVKKGEFPIAGGELVVKTRLSKVIAGVNVYGIVLERNIAGEEDVYFDNIEQLMEFADGNADGTSMHICSECGDIPMAGYYINNDTGDEYCSYDCLLKALNTKYGIFNWNTMMGDSDGFEVWLKITKEEAEHLNDYKKVNNQYWKRADIEFIPGYPSSEEDGDGFFNDVDFDEMGGVLL